MLTPIEKDLIIFSSERKTFQSTDFVNAHSEYKDVSVYAALRRLEAENYLTSVKETKRSHPNVPLMRDYKCTQAAKYIAKGLKMLRKE